MHAIQRPSLHAHTTALGTRGSQWRPFSSTRPHHRTSPYPRHRTQLSVTSQTDIPQTDTDYRYGVALWGAVLNAWNYAVFYICCVLYLRQPNYPIPQNAEQVAQQALAACQRAWKDGVRRQQLELLLPLIGASDIDDWCATKSLSPLMTNQVALASKYPNCSAVGRVG